MKGLKSTILNAFKTREKAKMSQYLTANALPEDTSYSDYQKSVLEDQNYMSALLTGKDLDGNTRSIQEKISLSEALKTDDVSIIMPRVISNILQEATEPAHFLTNSVAEVLRVGPNETGVLEFPTVGALVANYVGEGGDYPNMNLMFGENKVTMKLRKIGIMSNLPEEVIAESRFAMVALYLRAQAAAIRRKVESSLFDVMQQFAQVVYNNESTDADYHTSGLAQDQTNNYSFSYWDLLTMTGVLFGNRYQATHVLGHPLGWSFIQMDPYLRATFMHQGQIGGPIWNTQAGEDVSGSMPFGLSYVPYYAIGYEENSTLSAGPGSALSTSLISDIFVLDQKNALYFANRGEMEMDEMDDWYKDSKTMKVRQYVAFSSKDAGRGMTVARNIRFKRNYEPIMTIQQAT